MSLHCPERYFDASKPIEFDILERQALGYRNRVFGLRVEYKRIAALKASLLKADNAPEVGSTYKNAVASEMAKTKGKMKRTAMTKSVTTTTMREMLTVPKSLPTAHDKTAS